jgi:hypothetical protein
VAGRWRRRDRFSRRCQDRLDLVACGAVVGGAAVPAQRRRRATLLVRQAGVSPVGEQTADAGRPPGSVETGGRYTDGIAEVSIVRTGFAWVSSTGGRRWGRPRSGWRPTHSGPSAAPPFASDLTAGSGESARPSALIQLNDSNRLNR